MKYVLHGFFIIGCTLFTASLNGMKPEEFLKKRAELLALAQSSQEIDRGSALQLCFDITDPLSYNHGLFQAVFSAVKQKPRIAEWNYYYYPLLLSHAKFIKTSIEHSTLWNNRHDRSYANAREAFIDINQALTILKQYNDHKT